MCGPVCHGYAWVHVCVCGAGYRIQSFILPCFYSKNQSTRLMTELVTGGGDRASFNAKPLTHNPSSYT